MVVVVVVALKLSSRMTILSFALQSRGRNVDVPPAKTLNRVPPRTTKEQSESESEQLRREWWAGEKEAHFPTVRTVL
jgi:hypothetical protein